MLSEVFAGAVIGGASAEALPNAGAGVGAGGFARRPLIIA